MLDEAGQAGSPLFHRVNIVRVAAIYELLRRQGDRLEQIAATVTRLEQHLPREAKYSVVFLGPVSGVAFGDNAQVEQTLLPDVRALLQEIRDALRPPPTDTDELLAPYLNWLIRQHSTLELRGIRRAGPSPVTPLEEVYAALKAETTPEAEWQESRRLLEEEVTAWLDAQGLTDLPEAERRRLRWRFLAGHPLMPALAERDRPRLFPERRSETLHLAEAVRRYRWLVILGDPGSGKTTLLRWLTLRLARALRDGAERVRVPAVHVNPAAEEDAADVGWQGQFPTFGREHPRQGERIPPDGLHRLITEWLRRGRAVVLLDGLDEITAADDRMEIVRAVETFIRDWVADPRGSSPLDRPDQPWPGQVLPTPADQGGNQIILTSHIAGYHDAPLSGRLTHATVQPMSDPAVDRFCRTWTAAVHRLLADPHDSEAEIQERAKNEADALIGAVHDPNRPGLRELAGNPLLLTVLAMVHHNSQARLPEQRVGLYQIAVENLVEVWRDTGLSEDKVVQVLAPVAAHIHQTSPTGLMEEGELRERVTRAPAEYRGVDPDRPTPAFCRDVANFLQAVRERVGLLAARGEAVYGFLHLTFQEYLAARHLAGDPNTALAAILERRNDPRWREPILLALGYLSGASEKDKKACFDLLRALLEAHDPLNDLLPRGPLLVAAALPEMVKAPPAVVEEVVRRLLRAYAALPYAWLREEVSRTLERLRRGDDAPLADRVLIEALTAPPPADAPDPTAAAAALIQKHRWFSRELAEALRAAAAIADGDDRARALADLAPHLASHPDLLSEALRPLRALVAPLGALSALAPLAGSFFVWPETPAAPWAALARAADAPAEAGLLVKRMIETAAEEGLPYTAEAAAALEALLEAGRLDAAAALLPPLQAPAPEALRQAEAWLNRPEPPLARHAALLLAEAGRLSAASLPHLMALLPAGPDRSRCRAALALYARSEGRRFAVSALGRETVEALAALYRQHRAEPQVSTALAWALKALRHDDPALLAAWAADLAAGREEAEAILGRVHALTPHVWAEMARHLRAGPPAVQVALLESLAWLLRPGNLPGEALPQARAILHDLNRQGEGKVRRAAVAALGCLPSPQPEDWQALLPLRADSAADARVRALALARLGARLPRAERAPLEATLREALADPLLAQPAAGGLVRLWLADAEGEPGDFNPAPLLERLLAAAPSGLGLTPSEALAALLAAGTDDDVWGAYHERVVRAARALLVAWPDDLFAPLLDHLEDALTAADDWPPRRIALAVTAAAAEALPAHFGRRADPTRLEGHLVQAARDAESFSTRRFALTALSHLRRVTPAVAGALLAALRDAGRVQQDALAAAERFRLAEGDIVPALAAALQEESAATAYAAAQVLAALGRSAQAAAHRPAIIEALAAALRDARSRRGVYVLDKEQKIKYLGRLDEAFYRVLVQVTGAG